MTKYFGFPTRSQVISQRTLFDDCLCVRALLTKRYRYTVSQRSLATPCICPYSTNQKDCVLRRKPNLGRNNRATG